MLDKYVMLMIAKDVQPFSMVADEGFLDLMKKMDPKYKLPSRNYFRDVMLPKLYDELKEHLKSELNVVNYVAITTDG